MAETRLLSISRFVPEEPRRPPGYSGYIPGGKSQVGCSAGIISHEFLRKAAATSPFGEKFINESSEFQNQSRSSPHRVGESIGSSVPGYTGHIPFVRGEHGATFASSGAKASMHHYELQSRIHSQTREFQTTKACQQPLTEIPHAQRTAPSLKSAPAFFTPRTYSHSMGILPHSTVHVPQRRFRDEGQTFGKASRMGASLVPSTTHTSYHDSVVTRTTLVPTRPGRQWIV